MHPFEIFVYTIMAIIGLLVLAYEIVDWKQGNHPFQHMNKK